MSMTELIEILEENGKAVRAYGASARACRDRLKAHPDQSAAYFLLTVAAENFVNAFDDQPLISQRVEDEFLRFKSYIDLLHAAEQGGDADAKLATLNRIATEIATNDLFRPTSEQTVDAKN
ncbi:MAG: hypothetical protein ABJ215_08110 [Alphaproteobacteria bacterium]